MGLGKGDPRQVAARCTPPQTRCTSQVCLSLSSLVPGPRGLHTLHPKARPLTSTMPLARSLSVTSLTGLEDWEDEVDLENVVLFEVAWEVANKGQPKCLG